MTVEFFLLILAVMISSYVIGSLNGSIIVSKLFYSKDIREFGSGNAGLTNFYRTFGKGGTLLVILIDVLKTAIPVLAGGWLFSHFNNMPQISLLPSNLYEDSLLFGQVIAGFAVMLGHCFPLLYKFKGGKGVMAVGVIVIVIDWRVALIAWGIFILLVLVTRYVSLGSIFGTTAFAVSMMLFDIGGAAELCVVILCVLLVVIRHAENIKRIFKREESRFAFKKT